MSLTNLIDFHLDLSNIDAFTFGKSSLFGYDRLNGCLVLRSLNRVNDSTDKRLDRLRLSFRPTSSIRRLIVNPNETILAVLTDDQAYLVYLPQSVHWSGKSIFQ